MFFSLLIDPLIYYSWIGNQLANLKKIVARKYFKKNLIVN